MKKCPNCQQTYEDDDLNFCLNDGGILEQSREDSPPPTVMINQPRMTNPNFGNDFTQPISPWQNQSPQPFQPPVQTPMYMSPSYTSGGDQNLAIISLVMGSGSILFSFCCGWLGIPLGVAAVVMGFMGMNNATQNPDKYSGKNLAIGGMVTGAIGLLISVGLILLFLIARK
ncbi:hypothetical protein BH10ACI1_BH10ACI1_28580 [soil metagenome]